MKSTFLLIILFSFSFSSFAQQADSRGWYQRDQVENVYVGWVNKYTFKEPAKAFVQSGWNYPAKQMDHSEKIITWMQETYTCKGLMGEVKQSVLAPPVPLAITNSSYTYNEATKDNKKALPNTYGGYIKFHMNLVKTDTKKFWPMPGNHATMTLNVMANNVEVISKQIVNLSGPDEYYCIMPKYSADVKGNLEGAANAKLANYRNFLTSPNLAKYDHYFVPTGSEYGSYTIIMTKDKQPLPFEQVTVAEFIARFESRLNVMNLISLHDGTKLPNLIEGAKNGLQIMRETYKDEMKNFVYLTEGNTQIDIISLSQIEKGKNIYWFNTKALNKNGEYSFSAFPLLKLKKGVKESLANGGPQWMVFTLQPMIDPSDAGNVELMDNFVSRFNYDYVYEYFFGKDKVIEPYKPNDFISKEDKKENIAPVSLSEEAKKYATDKSVYFFDDFSNVAIDAPPASWATERNASGEKVEVKEIEGAKGKWLKLKKNASPKQFNSISGDFEASFDLLVQKGDVPWGTPGIQMQLKFDDNKQFGIDVSPGDMNRKDAAGWLILNGLPGGCKMASYYSLPDFTGSKQVNKVTMSVRRKGESVTVLCNGNKVYDCATAFASGAALKNVNFYVNEKNVFYISNIKISK